MKLFVSIFSVVMLIACLGLFVLKKPNGQAWLTLDDLSFNNTYIIENKFNHFYHKLSGIYENYIKEDNSQLKIYRWQDDNGIWIYSDNPELSVANEAMLVEPKATIVLPAITTQVDNSKTTAIESFSPKGTDKKKNASEPNVHLSKKLINVYTGANNVQQLMNDRQHNITKAIKESGG